MITYDTRRIAAWVANRFGGAATQADAAVGLSVDGQLRAGLLLYDYSGSNVWCHLVVDRASKAFLITVLDVLFNRLGVERVTFSVADDNTRCIALMGSLGAELEHVMRRGRTGGNTNLFVLWRGQGIHRRVTRHLQGGPHGCPKLPVRRA